VTTPRLAVRGQQREFSRVGEGHYRLVVLSLGIMFDVARLRQERRQEWIGELTVACDLPGAKTVGDDQLLSVADWNLSSADDRWKRAKLLAERSDAPDIDWASYLEELAQRTIAAERVGFPSRPLHTYDRPGPDAQFEVDGWRLLRDHGTIGYGDGGSAKSYLALYVAGRLAQRGVSVLYADWELGGEDHRDRLERLFGPQMPMVHYVRCDRALVSEADRLSREVRRLSIDYLICDSIAFATAGPPEAAEHATAYFRAVRQIGIGSLHLAHINKSEQSDQKPFGSSFWHNSARATWFVKQASASPDGQRLTIGLFNRKSNLTRLQPAVGFQFEFSAERTVVTRVNLADVEDLAGQLPLWQRIAHFLQAGGGVPRTIADIAEELEAKPDTVKKAVSPSRARGGKSMFTQVPSSDGIVRIALVERRTA
jgi:hypothetical protein